MDEAAHKISQHIGPGSVSVTRTGPRTYEGLNERGDVVLIGPAGVPGHFTPGELLKLALAGCAGMSSDRPTARRLGDDYRATVWAHGTADHGENRYAAVQEEILIDLSSLDAGERAELIALMEKSIARSCTVARSVDGSIALSTTIDGTPLGQGGGEDAHR